MNNNFRRSGFERLGGLVNNTMKDLGIQSKVIQRQAASRWNEVVGKQIAEASVVEDVRDGILFVCCKSSVWSNELNMHKSSIIKKLNKAVGKVVINDIRFTARGYRKAVTQNNNKNSYSTKVSDMDSIPVTKNDLEKATEISSKAPEELAEKIRKAYLNSRKLSYLKDNEESGVGE